MPEIHRSILESADDPEPVEVYRAAQAYVRSGLSLIPIGIGGAKGPDFALLPQIWSEARQSYRRAWSVFRTRRPSMDELHRWYNDGWSLSGIAILGGAISGGLEIIDLDSAAVAETWSTVVEQQLPGVLDRLVRVQTPRPGMHAYYRCEAISGSQKLARVPGINPDTGKPAPKTIIETKGEGGYCLAPPTPRIVHPAYRCYVFLGERDLTQINTISPAERATLHEIARSLNEWVEHRPERPRRKPTTGRQNRPGDDFNIRADWADILEPHGWKYVGTAPDGSERWRRPGKFDSISATVNYGGSDLLYVFTSNGAPFEGDRGYSKFHAYTLLQHNGDFRAAAAALAGQGYGSPRSLNRRNRASVNRHRNKVRSTTAGRHTSRRRKQSN